MTEVIVPLDGTQEAELALAHARALAGSGKVHLVTSVWHGEPPAPRRYHEERALALAGTPTDARIAVDERPSEAITRIASELPGSLVCMASHGRNALLQAVLGSTAEAYLRTATEPTVVVGPRAAFTPARWEARNLLVAVDAPETAATLAPVAGSLADRYGLHLWVLQSVAPAPYPFVDDVEAADVHEASGAHEMVRLLATDHHIAEAKVVIAADPADAIVRFAKDLPASLVVMGSHGRAGVSRIALGSVAMRAVHRAPCPVMVVKQ